VTGLNLRQPPSVCSSSFSNEALSDLSAVLFVLVYFTQVLINASSSPGNYTIDQGYLHEHHTLRWKYVTHHIRLYLCSFLNSSYSPIHCIIVQLAHYSISSLKVIMINRHISTLLMHKHDQNYNILLTISVHTVLAPSNSSEWLNICIWKDNNSNLRIPLKCHGIRLSTQRNNLPALTVYRDNNSYLSHIYSRTYLDKDSWISYYLSLVV